MEKRLADLILQALHLHAERRLCASSPRSNLADRAAPSDEYEAAQKREIEKAHAISLIDIRFQEHQFAPWCNGAVASGVHARSMKSCRGSTFPPSGWALADRHKTRYGPSFERVIVKRADGTSVRDADGRQILNFTPSQMSALLGYNHPVIVETVIDRELEIVSDALAFCVDR